MVCEIFFYGENAWTFLKRELFTLLFKTIKVEGIEVHPTPHFVPEGISSSMRDFIFLVFNFEVFNVLFFVNEVPQKKKYIKHIPIGEIDWFDRWILIYVYK